MEKRKVLAGWLAPLLIILVAAAIHAEAGGLAVVAVQEGGARSETAGTAMAWLMGPSQRRTLEDGIEPELPVDAGLHRRVLPVLEAGGSRYPGVLTANKEACTPKCLGRGRPYTAGACSCPYSSVLTANKEACTPNCPGRGPPSTRTHCTYQNHCRQ